MKNNIMIKMKNLLVIMVTAAIFLFLAVAAWLKPSESYSDSERRYLAKAPDLTADAVLNGTFMEKFESYAVDQFPARDTFRRLKSTAAIYGFGQQDVHNLYLYKGYISKMEYPLNEESLERAANVFQKIYDQYLAGTKVHTYFSVIPDKNCFMAEASGHLALDYEALYGYMQERTAYMEYIDIAPLLQLEDYYKTDSHWRQEKIVDVAQRLLNEMNEESNPAEKYTANILENSFYGVYAGQSGFMADGEELIYLDSEMLSSCRVYDYENSKEIGIYDMEKAMGKDPYEIFLSGPISLLTIENPAANTEKELILFRDSFGSSLAPLLVEEYAKITLVDIRYLSSALVENWITFDDQDVLFLYSIQVLNNSETLK